VASALRAAARAPPFRLARSRAFMPTPPTGGSRTARRGHVGSGSDKRQHISTRQARRHRGSIPRVRRRVERWRRLRARRGLGQARSLERRAWARQQRDPRKLRATVEQRRRQLPRTDGSELEQLQRHGPRPLAPTKRSPSIAGSGRSLMLSASGTEVSCPVKPSRRTQRPAGAGSARLRGEPRSGGPATTRLLRRLRRRGLTSPGS
jgi:hypothetical protein